MSRIHELYMRVREADESDFGKSIIRIHSTDMPQDIVWGDAVNISLDKKNWVTCELEPAGEMGTGHIYMDIHTRGLINRHTIGVPTAKPHEPCNIYIRKANRWRSIIFISVVVMVIVVVLYILYSLGVLEQILPDHVSATLLHLV